MNCPHCNTHIDEHGVSRCLNAWIAEAIMGGVETMNFQEKSECYWRFDTPEGKSMLVNSKVFQGSILWSPCTKIADAWEVAEKMADEQMPKHVGPTMLHRLRQCGMKGWGVIWCSDFGYTREIFAQTAPLAICRAAIKAQKE